MEYLKVLMMVIWMVYLRGLLMACKTVYSKEMQMDELKVSMKVLTMVCLRD